MADFSLRIEEAERWKADVNRLTEEIHTLLNKIKSVIQECTDHMADDEYFKRAFDEMVVKLANSFDKLVESFKKAVENLGKALMDIKSRADEIMESIHNAVQKIKNG